MSTERPRAKFNRSNRDTAYLDAGPGADPSTSRFASWLTAREDLPAELRRLHDAEEADRTRAARLGAAVRDAERDARVARAAAEKRLREDGEPIDRAAEDERQKTVADLIAEHTAAGQTHRASLQAYADGWDEHTDELRALTVRVALEAHADAQSAAAAFIGAVQAREEAYAALGAPGCVARGLQPTTGRSGPLYWAEVPRPPVLTIGPGAQTNYRETLDRVNELGQLFPAQHVAALAASASEDTK